MTTVSGLIAEIKTSLSQYDEAGLIDEVSIRRWIRNELKRFGVNIMTLQEGIINVKNSRAEMPDNYGVLYLAAKCEPLGYHAQGSKDHLQGSYFWKERIEKKTSWESCDPCCVDEQESRIVERLYFHEDYCDFYYKSPMLLRLRKGIKKSQCHSKCKNLSEALTYSSPYDINILKNTAYFNFEEGSVYLQYYGIDKDEDGEMLIPEDDHNRVETYLEYYIKRRIMEDVAANDDDPKGTASRMLSYYMQQEREQFKLALTSTKFSALSRDTFKKLKQKARRNTAQYEVMIPWL